MKPSLLLSLLIVAILLGSCEFPQQAMNAKTKAAMDTWIGVPQTALYQQKGPPDRITEDGGDGHILIYERYVDQGTTPGKYEYQQGGVATPSSDGGITWSEPGHVSYTPPQHHGYTLVVMYYVNKEGNIYNWRIESK